MSGCDKVFAWVLHPFQVRCHVYLQTVRLKKWVLDIYFLGNALGFFERLESLEKMISHDCKGAVIDFNMLDHTCTQSPGIGHPGCDGFLFAAVLQTFGPCGAL